MNERSSMMALYEIQVYVEETGMFRQSSVYVAKMGSETLYGPFDDMAEARDWLRSKGIHQTQDHHKTGLYEGEDLVFGYRVAIEDQIGRWVPSYIGEVGNANLFETVEEAREAIEKFREIGDRWKNSTYVIIQDDGIRTPIETYFS